MTDDIHGFLEDARARIAELEDRMRAGWYEDWKAMRQRAEKAEAERDEWIRWSVDQDGIQTDNLIREKERAELAEAEAARYRAALGQIGGLTDFQRDPAFVLAEIWGVALGALAAERESED